MQSNQRKKPAMTNSIISSLAADKKKTASAVCLVVLMLFMWFKVLGKKTPVSAGASVLSQQQQSPAKLSAVFAEPTVVKGRNDILTRDFFAVESWRDFIGGSDGSATGQSGQSQAGYIKHITNKLKLQAIMTGPNPQAFINDRLYRKGDVIILEETTQKFECAIENIEENRVIIRSGEAQIILQLMADSELTD